MSKILREALAIARKRIEYLGSLGNERHQKGNEDQFFPMIDGALASQPAAAPVGGMDRHAIDSASLSAARDALDIALTDLPLVQRQAKIQCAIADAILAITPPVVAGADRAWQPIDTAPRDGSPILCWCPDDEFKPITGIDLIWWEGSLRGGWTKDGDHPVNFLNKPTHWMPLPRPPLVDAGKVGEGKK